MQNPQFKNINFECDSIINMNWIQSQLILKKVLSTTATNNFPQPKVMYSHIFCFMQITVWNL